MAEDELNSKLTWLTRQYENTFFSLNSTMKKKGIQEECGNSQKIMSHKQRTQTKTKPRVKRRGDERRVLAIRFRDLLNKVCQKAIHDVWSA